MKEKTDIKNILDLKDLVINKIPDDFNKYESIIGDPFFVNQFRFSKFIKRNFLTMARNPILFFDKNKRNLKFHLICGMVKET